MTTSPEQRLLDIARELHHALRSLATVAADDHNGRVDIERRITRLRAAYTEAGGTEADLVRYGAAADADEIERKRLAREAAYQRKGY